MSTANGLWPLSGGPRPPRSCRDRAQSPTTPAELDAACLTLCQAWIAAGRPRGTRSIGSFEAWSQVIGGILEIAGVDGFLANLDEVMEAADSEGAVWRSLVTAWWDRFGTTEVGISDLYDLAVQVEPPLPLGAGNDRSQRIRLGIALGRIRDRIYRLAHRSVQVQAAGTYQGASRWRLVVADDPTLRVTERDTSRAVNVEGSLVNVGECSAANIHGRKPAENLDFSEARECRECSPRPIRVCARARAREKDTEEHSRHSQQLGILFTDLAGRAIGAAWTAVRTLWRASITCARWRRWSGVPG
jgi:hypothetical protein